MPVTCRDTAQPLWSDTAMITLYFDMACFHNLFAARVDSPMWMPSATHNEKAHREPDLSAIRWSQLFGFVLFHNSGQALQEVHITLSDNDILCRLDPHNLHDPFSALSQWRDNEVGIYPAVVYVLFKDLE